MKLRRLEIVVIGTTLAFAFFIGGFFTGRSWNTVNIVPVTAQSSEATVTGGIMQSPGASLQTVPENQTGSGLDTKTEDLSGNTAQTPQDNVNSGPSQEAAGTPGDGLPRGGDGKININLASQSELTDLPGIGSVLASRIVDHRRQHGFFERIEDIRNVSGIGEKRYEAIQDKITVG